MNTFELLVLVCGGLMTICNFCMIIASIIGKVKSPYKELKTELDEVKNKLKEHDSFFDSDKKKLDMLEEGNRVTQKALLALLAHGIDGNSISAMTEARDELQKYLINR